MIVNQLKSSLPGAWITDPNNGRKSVKGGNLYLKDKEEFKIELFNPLNENVMADIKLNGNSISTNGILVRPGQRIYLDCNFDNNKKFVFNTYTVGDDNESLNAISKNGNVEVFFYKEQVVRIQNWNTIFYPIYRDIVINPYRSNIWYGNNTGDFYGNLSNTTTSSSTQLPYLSTQNSTNISSLYNNVADNITNYSGDVKIDNETGRIEFGKTSSQTFTNVQMNFDSYYISNISYKILPDSKKPIEIDSKTKSNDDVLSKIDRLFDLKQKGAISHDEYVEKKNELLNRI